MDPNPRFRLFPMPVQSGLLFVVWLLMNNTLAVGHIFLAALLALAIPIAVSSLQHPQPTVHKPLLALRYFLLVLMDIVIANIQVAILILGPLKKMQPGFIAVPLDIKQNLPITLLASTVSLTPGTVSCDVSEDQCWLYIHALNLVDEQELINSIKNRYEAPLKEIFGC
ncbi:Na+/H+ antiporter subunit E [Marinospirillum insulare]|uniref:Monovalent cation/H+ antiporter subunit E n=1 Tax=Marinospirillum insulare TaxID=217169 RepID=A0ABQ5ZYQ3_9GAMM|nr:Na+/H+ antiporter subunit E [Marinospirillum insulare]GLR64631.1 monovalent cation/H+ antiporter subunit E [Marinospirillum insulare]